MKENKFNIQIRLLSVTEISSKILLEKVNGHVDPEELKIEFSHQVDPDVTNNTLHIIMGVRYVFKNEVVLESVYKFTYIVSELSKYVKFNENNSIVIMHLMPQLLSVTVDTMRGILLVKTAGTVFSRYLLPLIDVNMFNRKISKRGDA